MSDRLITLATFPSMAEAAIARGILHDSGIPAQIGDDTAVWAFSQLLGSVRLIVREADAIRAEQLLDEALGEPLEASDDSPEDDAEEASEFGTGEPNPYYIRPESAVAAPPATRPAAASEPPEHIRDLIDRAWRAAWISPILLPPLANFYSAWLLLLAARENIELSAKYNRRFHGALAINLIISAAAITWWVSIVSNRLPIGV